MSVTALRPSIRVRVGRGCAGPEPRKARKPHRLAQHHGSGSADRDKLKAREALDAEASSFSGVHPCSTPWAEALRDGERYPIGMIRCRRCNRDCPPIAVNAQRLCVDCEWYPAGSAPKGEA